MNDGGPAKDMSLQDYACIKLKIPETGRPWFDDLIRKSLLNDFAAKAMQGLLSNQEYREQEMAKVDSTLPAIIHKVIRETIRDEAYEMADTMLKAREQ
ncbi:hypothetical protein LCGC14_1279060 [marine sediment metagenome]|uniref:Uncharacterized protein n=1 Tax=marine sediment metagenome TaxID=412755 RepID=A0A0F9NYU7_9ZZZZ